MTKFQTTLRTCACGTEFYGKGRAKWCSDRCRKDTLYVRHCLDCGAKLNGSDGNGPNASVRCVLCASRKSGEARRHWTREIVVERIQEWVALYGYVPGFLDWQPTEIRRRVARGGAPPSALVRAERFDAADHYWPRAEYVHAMFGSWNTAITAAGFEPRAAHGGAGNWRRRGVYEVAA